MMLRILGVMLLFSMCFSEAGAAAPDTAVASVYLFLDEECPICRYYAPALQALADEFSPRITFTGVFPTAGANPDSLAVFARTYGLNFLLLPDAGHRLTERLDARVTPQAVVVSASGEILYSGRIDNSFYTLGRRRAKPTTAELRAVLTAITRGQSVPQFANAAPVGCIIERRRK